MKSSKSMAWTVRTVAVVVVAVLVVVLAVTTNKRGPTSESARVTIRNYMFTPMTLTVNPGETIKVTNKDFVVHTLTSINGKFNSGWIGPGVTKFITAPITPGTYDYICGRHRYMYGEIIVK